MNMPGFTAGASLYQTSMHYVGRDGGYLSNGSTVSPQACGFAKNILCNGAIVGCAACLALVPAGPAAVIACYAGCLGITLFGFCRDCLDLIDIPGNGGGGGGGGGSPAGGTCFPNKCCEWDQNGECRLCIPRNAVCP